MYPCGKYLLTRSVAPRFVRRKIILRAATLSRRWSHKNSPVSEVFSEEAHPRNHAWLIRQARRLVVRLDLCGAARASRPFGADLAARRGPRGAGRVGNRPQQRMDPAVSQRRAAVETAALSLARR